MQQQKCSCTQYKRTFLDFTMDLKLLKTANPRAGQHYYYGYTNRSFLETRSSKIFIFFLSKYLSTPLLYINHTPFPIKACGCDYFKVICKFNSDSIKYLMLCNPKLL